MFQFYPENPAQMEMITNAAMRCGFTGGIVVDYPNSTKAKKYFLVLFAGTPVSGSELPQGLGQEVTDEDEDKVKYSKERRSAKKKKLKGQHRDPVKSKVSF